MSLAQRFQPIHCTTSKNIVIGNDGSIRSSRFNDIYFNPSCGAEETDHVFINGNQLKQRWQGLQQCTQSAPAPHFVIAETGFGTGLNFLVAATLWQSIWKGTANNYYQKPTLYFYSCERFPLTRTALKKVINCYNPFPDLAAALIEKYPDPIAGCYLLNFENDHCQTKLILLLGDSVECLRQLEHYPAKNNDTPMGLKVDAWFLDGFAPALNPDLWSAQLFKCIQSYSHSNTTLATFSAARMVKDQLQKNNFNYKKLPGFAKKREMISANYNVCGTNHLLDSDPLSPCYYRASFSRPTNQPHCAVIGSGIAGSCIAYLLAQSGWKVSVIEANNQLAQGASGNSTGILYARTAKERSALADFHEAAFNLAVDFYRSLKSPELTSGLCGMIKLHESVSENILSHNCELELRNTIDQFEASRLSGIGVSSGGVFYHNAGYIEPHKLCAHLLLHKNITLITNQRVTSLRKKSAKWQLSSDAQNIIEADRVVIACGQHSNAFSQTQWIPIKPLRGQTTELKPGEALYDQLQRAKISVCDKGYVTPSANQQISLGASFTLNNLSTKSNRQDHCENLQKLIDSLSQNEPARQEAIQLKNNPAALENINGRTGFRAVMPDYLPVAGPVVKQQSFLTQFAQLRLNAKKMPEQFARAHEGLYIIAGFGSHGFTTAPLAAELLVAQINSQPIPFSDKLRQALAPQRFLIRQIIRGKA